MAGKLVSPWAEFKNSSMANNRFYGPLSKLYEGPLNDIRQKVVEEAWFSQYPGNKVSGDLELSEPATLATAPATEVGAAPKPSVTDAHFTDVYGPSMEAPPIEGPTIGQPRLTGPRIDP